MTAFVPLETFARVGPLGVRFWDPVEQAFVAGGLVVNVRLVGSEAHTLATANRSGIFTAHNLPFLHAAERGAGDDAYWSSVVPRSFVVEVDDPLGRFLAFSFPAQLPARGLFVWSCPLVSPPSFGIADGVTLFSAPSRPVATMRAVIRADLQDAASGEPAAGAVLQATIDGVLNVEGIADARGRVAIVFPYPEPRDFPPVDGSPLPPTGSSLTAHTWPVVLSVRYGASAPYPAYPDLCTTLSQPPATLLSDASGAALGAQTLTMGTELVVRSRDVSSAEMAVALVKR